MLVPPGSSISIEQEQPFQTSSGNYKGLKGLYELPTKTCQSQTRQHIISWYSEDLHRSLYLFLPPAPPRLPLPWSAWSPILCLNHAEHFHLRKWKSVFCKLVALQLYIKPNPEIRDFHIKKIERTRGTCRVREGQECVRSDVTAQKWKVKPLKLIAWTFFSTVWPETASWLTCMPLSNGPDTVLLTECSASGASLWHLRKTLHIDE